MTWPYKAAVPAYFLIAFAAVVLLNTLMRKVGLILLLCLVMAVSAVAQNERPKYRLGVLYSLGNVLAAESPRFSFNHAYGLLGGITGERASLTFSVRQQRNYSDSAASGNFGFFAKKDDATLLIKSVRAGFDVDVRLKTGGTLRPTLGAGLGYLVWQVDDPAADTVMTAIDDNDNRVDFKAAEMYLSAAAGCEIWASPQVMFQFRTSLDYLTGVGTAFNDATNDARARTRMQFGLSLSYLFGDKERRYMTPPTWPSAESWEADEESTRQKPAERDSDGDGVYDKYDNCANTPPGAYVDKSGCPRDSDGDGILDGLDDCPKTPRSAVGFVDIFGCPIDSDYDGVPDYRDDCRGGPVGALVGENGCPLDSDGDGVYDGLDDCPGTQAGIEVDERGCIDVSFIMEPTVVNVDYQPGSFEIDPRTKERLQPLILKLKILTDVRIAVYGYTDNVGPAEANQSVSQKRANRMRDWLESQGIAPDRLSAKGRGETNFLASNQTAEGRAKNRRIELVFSR